MILNKDRKTKENNQRKNKNILVLIATIVILIIVSIVFIIFSRFMKTYREATFKDSSNQLMELTDELGLLINEKLKNNWNIAETLSSTLSDITFIDTDDATAFIQKQVKIWDVIDIYLVNAQGNYLNKDQIHDINLNNDEVTQFIINANNNLNKRYYHTNSGFIYYTKAVDSESQLYGEDIVGIIVLKNITTLFDSINFSAFNNEGSVYFTDFNGVIYCRENSLSEKNVYNIYSIFEESELRYTDLSLEQIRLSLEPQVFMFTYNGIEEYVIINPIHINNNYWNIIYIVPVSTVNKTMDDFNSYIIFISIIILILILSFVLVFFIIMYRDQSKKYSLQLSARERLFDLLVNETNNVFGLIRLGVKEPVYITSNYQKVMKKDVFYLYRENGVVKVNSSDLDIDFIDLINENLAKWNGKDIFTSPALQIKNGRGMRYYSFNLYSIQEEEDEYIVIINDITEEKHREQALEQALELADSANKAKTEFLANMSHDIRTPMNAILNMTNFAIEHFDNRTLSLEYLQVVQKSSKHLLNLINDVLEVSRIESGKTVFARNVFNLIEYLNNIKDIITPLCKEKEQVLLCDFTNIQHSEVKGDSLKIGQALINILNNAIKFTPKKGRIVFVAQELDSIKSEVAPIRFIISDNGIGISEHDINNIFNPFTRSNNDLTNHTEGTGLGLTIAKNFVEGMGGNIIVESTLNKGSTFTVELPLERNYSKVPSSNIDYLDEGYDFHGYRCLLVEDNEINLQIAKHILEEIGMKVDIAYNGQEAVGKFENNNPGYYDIIYMDVQMPILNGYQATIKIRESVHQDSKEIPIVAMTANVFYEDVEKARSHGMNAHVGKPIDCRELFMITKKLLKGEKKL